jgi:hypothetical protein
LLHHIGVVLGDRIASPPNMIARLPSIAKRIRRFIARRGGFIMNQVVKTPGK